MLFKCSSTCCLFLSIPFAVTWSAPCWPKIWAGTVSSLCTVRWVNNTAPRVWDRLSNLSQSFLHDFFWISQTFDVVLEKSCYTKPHLRSVVYYQHSLSTWQSGKKMSQQLWGFWKSYSDLIWCFINTIIHVNKKSLNIWKETILLSYLFAVSWHLSIMINGEQLVK